jgi:aminopeptidase
MIDHRDQKLAKLLLNYAVELRSDDRLLIQFDPAFSQLAFSLGQKAREMGATVRYDASTWDPIILRSFIANPNPVLWQEELARRSELAAWCSARILIDAESVSDFAKGIPNKEELTSQFLKEVDGPYKEVLYRPSKTSSGTEVRWNLVGYPSAVGAKAAHKSEQEYTDFVYSAMLDNDWENVHRTMQTQKQRMDNAKDIHIVVPGLTDLHLKLEGREAEICAGKHNMPDGEFFYGPVEDATEGYIYFNHPSQRTGTDVIEGIRLEFKNGVVVKSSAAKNAKELEAVLNTDEGARRIGELGIGTNYGIKRATLSTLFDEKIGGSIHLALGSSLNPGQLNHGGGLNQSGIHWDIVCDLRPDPQNLMKFPGGFIYLDGKLIQKHGQWI